VLLIHGLAESEWRMLPISLWLTYAGYKVVGVTYPSTLYPAEILAEEYIAPLLHDLESEEILHVVTHSMGGILLRYCLQSKLQENLKRVVMVTPANHGSELLEIYRHNPFMAALLGSPLQQSGLGENCFPCSIRDNVDYEIGIIAGDLPIDPISLAAIPWPHDGRTSVKDTKLNGMKDHITIAASHDFITFHPFAIYQTEYFLKHGQFYRPFNNMEEYIPNDNENAKNEKWQAPVKFHDVKPEDYDVSIASANGSAHSSKKSIKINPARKTSADSPK
jgi:triacylglycerol lipase